MSYQLSCGKLTPHQTVVRLDVLDVRITDFTSEKVEVFHLLVVLDSNWRFNVRLILCFKIGLLAIEFSHFFDDSDEETTGILVMWHDSQALWQLAKNALIVVTGKHSVTYLCSLILRYAIETLILFKVAFDHGLIVLRCFPLLVDSVAISPLLHVKEGPAGHTRLESKAL